MKRMPLEQASRNTAVLGRELHNVDLGKRHYISYLWCIPGTSSHPTML